MKVLVQRVSHAEVRVAGSTIGKIENGLLLLVGVAQDDTQKEIEWVAEKCVNLRIFEDDQQKMNRSLLDAGGSILAISQFTLMANTEKGRRPSFIEAADPEKGNQYYELFVEALRGHGIHVETGVFGAMMDIELVNRGPVTIMVESKK